MAPRCARCPPRGRVSGFWRPGATRMKWVSSVGCCGRCRLAATEHGPRAVPRSGSKCAAPRCARGSLRCSRHKGGCGTAVRSAERAADFTASSPVRRQRRRTPPCVAALLAGPHSPEQGTALGPNGRSCCSSKNTVVPRKAVVGCAPAATYAAPRSAGLRGLRVAQRRRVGHTLFELRAQRRCASSVAPARGRACVAALAARAPQGTLRAAEGAAFERRRIPGRGFASLARCRKSALHVAQGPRGAVDH